MTNRNWERKTFITSHRRESILEGSQGTSWGQEPGARNWSRDHGGMLLTGLLSVVAQPFSYNSEAPAQGLYSQSPVGWVLPHQSLIKNRPPPTDLLPGNLMEEFSELRFLFLDNSNSWQLAKIQPGLSVNLKLIRLARSFPPVSFRKLPVSALPLQSTQFFYVGPGNPNSGCHVWRTCTLPMSHLPNPCSLLSVVMFWIQGACFIPKVLVSSYLDLISCLQHLLPPRILTLSNILPPCMVLTFSKIPLFHTSAFILKIEG